MKLKLSNLQVGDVITYTKITYIIIYVGKYGVTALNTHSYRQQSLAFTSYNNLKANLLTRTGLTTLEQIQSYYPEYFL